MIIKQIFGLFDSKRKNFFFYLCFLMILATLAEILGIGLIISGIYVLGLGTKT